MSIVYRQPTEATETFRVCINTTFEARCNMVMVRPREINETPVGNSYTNNKVQVRRGGPTMILTPYTVQKLAYQVLLSQLTVAEVPKDFELRTIDEYLSHETGVCSVDLPALTVLGSSMTSSVSPWLSCELSSVISLLGQVTRLAAKLNRLAHWLNISNREMPQHKSFGRLTSA